MVIIVEGFVAYLLREFSKFFVLVAVGEADIKLYPKIALIIAIYTIIIQVAPHKAVLNLVTVFSKFNSSSPMQPMHPKL